MEHGALEEGLERGIKTLFLNSVPRYYEHTMQVVSNMKGILEGKDYGEERETVLIAAAYLHDIGYSAPFEGDFVGNIDDQSLKIPKHCETGVDISREGLAELGLEKGLADRVVNLVAVHHGVPQPEENLKLLLEADKA